MRTGRNLGFLRVCLRIDDEVVHVVKATARSEFGVALTANYVNLC